jgi:hypothetical protein
MASVVTLSTTSSEENHIGAGRSLKERVAVALCVLVRQPVYQELELHRQRVATAALSSHRSIIGDA